MTTPQQAREAWMAQYAGVASPHDEYVTVFNNCRKCGASMGQMSCPRSMLADLPNCETCQRIEAWMPDFVAAVAKALQQQDTIERLADTAGTPIKPDIK